MAHNSLNEFSSFVNQQLPLIEDLDEHLAKASALIEVALRYDLSELSERTLHNYLWALNDIIKNAYDCNQLSLGDVFTASKFINTVTATQSPLGEAK